MAQGKRLIPAIDEPPIIQRRQFELDGMLAALTQLAERGHIERYRLAAAIGEPDVSFGDIGSADRDQRHQPRRLNLLVRWLQGQLT